MIANMKSFLATLQPNAYENTVFSALAKMQDHR
jgi:hypothetical protein